MPEKQKAATKRVHFTVRALNALPFPKQGRVTVYDAKSNLGLRVDSNGTKSFFFFRTGLQGKPIFRSIGTYPSTLIEDARAEANRLQGMLEAWRTRKYAEPDPFADAEAEPTFQELVDRYVAKRVLGHAARPEKARKAVEWTVKRYLTGPHKDKKDNLIDYGSDWTGKPLSRITDKEVRARHLKIAEESGKIMADRTVQLVRRLFRWAILKEKMFTGPNPAIGIEYYGHTPREWKLTSEDIARFFHELGKETNRDLSDAVWLLLATEARRSDVLGMRWHDVKDGVWTVWKPKGGLKRAYRQILIPEAIEVLNARRKIVKSEDWVFPSAISSSGHLEEIKRSWRQLLKRAKISDLHAHDLRHCLPSMQITMGYSLPIIGKGLGHKPGSPATSIYANLDLAPSNQAMTAAMTKLKADAATEAKKLGL